ETLREYWRWMKPKTYLVPGTVKGWRADVPITEKIVWQAVNEAAKRAGITKHVSPHSLRHYSASRKAWFASATSACSPTVDAVLRSNAAALCSTYLPRPIHQRYRDCAVLPAPA